MISKLKGLYAIGKGVALGLWQIHKYGDEIQELFDGVEECDDCSGEYPVMMCEDHMEQFAEFEKEISE